MSYSIEYEKKAFVFDSISGEKNYLIYNTMADNNVSPRVPSPNFISYGWNYQAIKEICKLAGYCEGGMLKPKNRDCSPESYVKVWRKKIAEAKPFSEFRKEFPTAQFRVAVEKEQMKEFIDKKENEKSYEYEIINKFVSAGNAYMIQFIGNYLVEFQIRLENEKSFTKYFELEWVLKQKNLLYYHSMDEQMNGYIGKKIGNLKETLVC